MSDIIPFTRVCSVCWQPLCTGLLALKPNARICAECEVDETWEWLQARLARTAEIFSTDTTPRIVQ